MSTLLAILMMMQSSEGIAAPSAPLPSPPNRPELLAPPPPPPPAPTGKAKKAVIISGSITEADYPRDALRISAEGTSTATYTISKEGQVTDCFISKSSGNASLDSTTCNLIMTRFRFRPARNAKGKATEETRTNSVRWAIPKDDYEPASNLEPVAPYRVELRVLVDESGTLSDCKKSVEGIEPKDMYSCDGIMRKRGLPDEFRSKIQGSGVLVSLVRQSDAANFDVNDGAVDGGEIVFQARMVADVAPDGTMTGCQVSSRIGLSDDFLNGCPSRKFVPLPTDETGRAIVTEASIVFFSDPDSH